MVFTDYSIKQNNKMVKSREFAEELVRAIPGNVKIVANHNIDKSCDLYVGKRKVAECFFENYESKEFKGKLYVCPKYYPCCYDVVENRPELIDVYVKNFIEGTDSCSNEELFMYFFFFTSMLLLITLVALLVVN